MPNSEATMIGSDSPATERTGVLARPVLIVDDDQDTRQLLSAILCQAGYTDVRLAGSAAEAFVILGVEPEQHHGEQIDLVLMDVTMSPVDGIAACRRIKAVEHLQDVPIIMVTGRSRSDNLKMAFDAGAVDYVSKPLNRTELLARVHSALRLKHEINRHRERERDLLAVTKQLEAANRLLDQLSRQDSLTGIANRRQFDDFLDHEWHLALRRQAPISLIMIDIDHFKRFNDALGHQRGDDCLRKVALALREGLHRITDFVARYGGEEFAVILPETTLEGACQVAERLRIQIEALGIAHPASDICRHVTVSLGVASVCPSRDASPVDLLRAADRALYEAKSGGRNQVRIAPAP